MLDANRKVVGAADYDVFGQVNRVSLDKETAHPYPLENITLADFTQPTGGTANPSTSVNIRALYNMVDTAAVATAYTFLQDGSTGTALTPNYGGPHAGQVWTPWETPSAAAAGHVKAQFVSTASGTQKGIVMEAYEYQRYQTGSTAFWTPLRFPGQYYDQESDLHQNWNRFYDPSIGRYLESEPYLLNPLRVLTEARNGRQMPAYAYAFNNPVNYADPTGLGEPGLACVPGDSTVVCCLKQHPGEFEQCGADPADCVNKCVVKATTAYAICRAAGEPSGNCEYSANKSIAGCIKNCPNQCSGGGPPPGGPPGGGPPGPIL